MNTELSAVLGTLSRPPAGLTSLPTSRQWPLLPLVLCVCWFSFFWLTVRLSHLSVVLTFWSWVLVHFCIYSAGFFGCFPLPPFFCPSVKPIKKFFISGAVYILIFTSSIFFFSGSISTAWSLSWLRATFFSLLCRSNNFLQDAQHCELYCRCLDIDVLL